MKISTDFNYKKVGYMVGEFIMGHRLIVTSLLILVCGVVALQRITFLTKPEIDQGHLKQQIETLEVVNFDQEAIDRISELEASNIEIRSQFTERNNPFGE